MQKALQKFHRHLMSNKTLFVFRLIVGLIFIIAGIATLMAPQFEFEAIMVEYDLLPTWVIPPFAFILPWIELIAGVFLIIGMWLPVAAFTLVGLLITYIGAIGINLFIRGISLEDCGCFGGNELMEKVMGSSSEEALIRDVVLLFMAGYVLYDSVKDYEWFQALVSRFSKKK